MSASSSLQTSLPSDDAPQLVDRGHVHPAVGVDRDSGDPARYWTEWLPLPSVSATRSAAVEIDAVVVDEVGILVRILAAGAEPDLPLRLVDAVDAPHDVIDPW